MNDFPSPVDKRSVHRPKRSFFFSCCYPALVGIWTVLAVYAVDCSRGWGAVQWGMIYAPIVNLAFVLGSVVGVEVRKVFDRSYRPGPVWAIVVMAPLVSQVAIIAYVFTFGHGGG